MWSRTLTDEEEKSYSYLNIFDGSNARVKNEILQELQDELDSVIVAAALLDYDINLAYAKSHVRFVLHFSDPKNRDKNFLLSFSCQNEIRELDYIVLQQKHNDNYSDLYFGSRDGYILAENKSNFSDVGLHKPIQRIKEFL